MRSIRKDRFPTINHAKPHISIAYGAAYQRHNCGVAVVIRDTWQKLSKACAGEGEGWKKKDPTRSGWGLTFNNNNNSFNCLHRREYQKPNKPNTTKLRKATLSSSPRRCTIIVSNPTTWSRFLLESRDWAEGSRVSVRVSWNTRQSNSSFIQKLTGYILLAWRTICLAN